MNLARKVINSMIEMLEKFEETSHAGYFLERYQYIPVKSFDPLDDQHASLLGEGAFGSVYKVQRKDQRSEYAVKIVEMNYEQDYSEGSSTSLSANDIDEVLSFVRCCQEACLLSKLQHGNIVKVRDKWIQQQKGKSKSSAVANIQLILRFLRRVDDTDGNIPIPQDIADAMVRTKDLTLYMVMDLYDTNLEKWLEDKKNRLDESNKAEIIRRLILALFYLQTKNYCHLDLKPRNILLRQTMIGLEVALTDFGLCKLYSSSTVLDGESSESRDGTRPYNTAPDELISDKFDIWSFGLIVYYIITSKTNFKILENVSRLEDIKDLSDIKILHDFKPIVLQCLQPNSQQRVSAAELKSTHCDKQTETQTSTDNYDSEQQLSIEDHSNYLSATWSLDFDSGSAVVPEFTHSDRENLDSLSLSLSSSDDDSSIYLSFNPSIT